VGIWTSGRQRMGLGTYVIGMGAKVLQSMTYVVSQGVVSVTPECRGALCASPTFALEDEAIECLTGEEDIPPLLERVHARVTKLLPVAPERVTVSFATKHTFDALNLDFFQVRMHFPAHRLSPELEIVEELQIEWKGAGWL